jgi:adenylyltransferase/sulfurtransferase
MNESTDNPPSQNRHDRQLALDGWGDDAQKRLSESYVVVVGAGAIGAALATQLAGAGVAHLGVVDGTLVQTGSLGGQTTHFAPDTGANKADALAHKIGLLDPEIQCDPFPANVDHDNANAITAGAGLVADCTRDGATTLRLAAACAQAGTTLLVGTAAGWRGATLALGPGSDLPSSELPQAPGHESLHGPTAAAVAADLAQRALALLSRTGDPGLGELREYDGLSGHWSLPEDSQPPD